MLSPPIELMQPETARELPRLPEGSGLYQLKADGWRCACFVRGGGEVYIQGRPKGPRRQRTAKDLTAYFPELLAPLAALPAGTVLDAEAVAWSIGEEPALNFTALAKRPPRRGVSVQLLAFDLLSDGRVRDDHQDIRRLPLADRWDRLVELLADARDETGHVIEPIPSTTDRALAEQWATNLRGRGFEGLVLKRLDAPYGRTGSWWKHRHERTFDGTVVGVVGASAMRVRLDEDGTEVETEPLTPTQAHELATVIADREQDDEPLRVELRVGAGRHGRVSFVRVRPDW